MSGKPGNPRTEDVIRWLRLLRPQVDHAYRGIMANDHATADQVCRWIIATIRQAPDWVGWQIEDVFEVLYDEELRHDYVGESWDRLGEMNCYMDARDLLRT